MAVDGEECADEGEDDAREQYAAESEGDDGGRDERGNAFVPRHEGIDAAEDDAVGKDSCQQAHAHGVEQEGFADESPTGSDEFHYLDGVAPAGDGEPHGVVDEGEADDGEQCGDDKQDDGELPEVVVHLCHQVLGVDDVRHAGGLAEVGGERLYGVVAGIFCAELHLERGGYGAVSDEFRGVASHGFGLDACGLFLRDVAYMLGVGHTPEVGLQIIGLTVADFVVEEESDGEVLLQSPFQFSCHRPSEDDDAHQYKHHGSADACGEAAHEVSRMLPVLLFCHCFSFRVILGKYTTFVGGFASVGAEKSPISRVCALFCFVHVTFL